MRGRIPEIILVALCFCIVQCGGEPERNVGWTEIKKTDFSELQFEQAGEMYAAKDSLATRLKKRLQKAMKESGPAHAITVCREAAPMIAAEISEQEGLSIGRTSFRLRNPGNVAPDWANEYVEQIQEGPVFLQGEGTKMAALIPIRLNRLCETCHGPEEEIPSDVAAALAAEYPEDQATGFKSGALRGWFWVETAADDD